MYANLEKVRSSRLKRALLDNSKAAQCVKEYIMEELEGRDKDNDDPAIYTTDFISVTLINIQECYGGELCEYTHADPDDDDSCDCSCEITVLDWDDRNKLEDWSNRFDPQYIIIDEYRKGEMSPYENT